jgi:uncharacterized membrane protein
MKAIVQFIKTTITGGLLFLIPVVLIVMVVGKAFRLLSPLVEKALVLLHIETGFGKLFLSIITAVLLGVIAFIAGLMIRLNRVKRVGKVIEELVLKFVPGFAYLKVIAGEQTGVEAQSNWKAVLLEDNAAWVIAFIVEENANGYSVVFIPESPKADSGNSKMILTSSLRYHPMSMREALNCLRHYGAGVLPQVAEEIKSS